MDLALIIAFLYLQIYIDGLEDTKIKNSGEKRRLTPPWDAIWAGKSPCMNITVSIWVIIVVFLFIVC